MGNDCLLALSTFFRVPVLLFVLLQGNGVLPCSYAGKRSLWGAQFWRNRGYSVGLKVDRLVLFFSSSVSRRLRG